MYWDESGVQGHDVFEVIVACLPAICHQYHFLHCDFGPCSTKSDTSSPTACDFRCRLPQRKSHGACLPLSRCFQDNQHHSWSRPALLVCFCCCRCCSIMACSLPGERWRCLVVVNDASLLAILNSVTPGGEIVAHCP